MTAYIRRLFLTFFTVLAMGSTLVSASELSDAFNSLSYSNGVDKFNTEVRTGIAFGSGRIQFGTNGGNLPSNTISFTKPDFSASCSGISWTFGGFSFVNGDEIIQALEAALPAAAMYVMGIVVSGLCEQCWTGLQHVFDAVNKVTNALRNSCDLGATLAEASGIADGARAVRQKRCEVEKSVRGMVGDSYAGTMSCAQADATDTYFQTLMNDLFTKASSGTPDETEAATAKIQEDCPINTNNTWCALNQIGVITTWSQCPKDSGGNKSCAPANVGVVYGEMFQSIMGVTVPGADGIVGIAGTSQFKELMNYMMCGSLASQTMYPSAASMTGGAYVAAEFCWRQFHPGQDPNSSSSAAITDRDFPMIIACSPDSSVPNERQAMLCDQPTKVSLNIWLNRADVNAVLGQGFLAQTTNILYGVIQKMKNGGPLITDSEKKFIQEAPFPLYRLLNMAALFPSVETDILKTNAIVIGYLMSHAWFNEVLAQASRRPQQFRGASTKVLDALNQMTKEMKSGNERFLAELDEDSRRAGIFTQNVERIHQDMLRVVYNNQLKGNYMATADLARLTIPTYR